MGIPVEPPEGSEDDMFVVFSGVEHCPLYAGPFLASFYELETLGGGDYRYSNGFIIVFEGGNKLLAVRIVSGRQHFFNDEITDLPFFAADENTVATCPGGGEEYGGNAYGARYDNSGPYTSCITNNLYNMAGTMFEAQHIEADSQTFAVANSKDSTRFLLKMDSP